MLSSFGVMKRFTVCGGPICRRRVLRQGGETHGSHAGGGLQMVVPKGGTEHYRSRLLTE